MKVFVLQAQGFGDNEYEFYNIGVYLSEEGVKQAQQEVLNDFESAQFLVEEYEAK